MSTMIKIASLNTWNLNRAYKARMALIDEYISKSSPDIICLQEISLEDPGGAPQTHYFTNALRNYCELYSSQGKWGEREEGLSTLTRLPVVAFQSLMLPDSENDMQRRVQFAVLKYSESKLIIANTHLSYHLDSEEGRIKQVSRILEHLERLSVQHGTKNIVLAGDLNSSPESEAVSVIFSSKLGFIDPFKESGLQARKFSFPRSSPFSNEELWPDRWIDYIFVTGPLEATSVSLALDGERGQPFVSDHAALELTINLLQ